MTDFVVKVVGTASVETAVVVVAKDEEDAIKEAKKIDTRDFQWYFEAEPVPEDYIVVTGGEFPLPDGIETTNGDSS